MNNERTINWAFFIHCLVKFDLKHVFRHRPSALKRAPASSTDQGEGFRETDPGSWRGKERECLERGREGREGEGKEKVTAIRLRLWGNNEKEKGNKRKTPTSGCLGRTIKKRNGKSNKKRKKEIAIKKN